MTTRPPAAPVEQLTAAAARRIALSAQGLAAPRPADGIQPDRRHLRRVLGHVGLLQIDSVNVVARSHYLPLFARLGPYPTALLDRAAYTDHELFEYWGHEASLLPVSLYPLLRWRMERRARGEGFRRVAAFGRERRPYLDEVLAQVTARGPLGAGELAEPGVRGGNWWGWHDGKIALEYLFGAGIVTTAERRGFERLYDLTERVLPPAVLAAPVPDEAEAQRGLLRVAATALGVATAGDLADYFRLPMPAARPRIAELVEAGELLPVEVAGWGVPALLASSARRPRRVHARALLSPFDSLVWERARSQRLFGFHLRLEIYTPAPKRVWGYYVLPFLLGDRLVGRVDLKADRATGVLRVLAAYTEEHASAAVPEVATELAAELTELAGWLGLGSVEVLPRGDLAGALAAAVDRG